MSTVHFLNVGNGDCSIIQHGSGRVSLIDISNGQLSRQEALAEAIRSLVAAQSGEKRAAGGGDFKMRFRPTNPLDYLRRLGVKEIFRFILTHPDMDHLDGFKSLCDGISVRNFWDSGVRRAKPSFSAGRYREEDWDHYALVRDGKGGVTVVKPLAGSRFDLANQGGTNDRGDCLDIVAPNQQLVSDANASGDPNDGSYVLVYRSMGGPIVFAGDSHDATWEYILHEHKSVVENCKVLIAPHHGRASGREYGFLDVLKPKLTLFGCADSEHLGYSAWINRGLRLITNNQAGNVVLDGHSAGIDIYVENLSFAETLPGFIRNVAKYGCHYIGRV